MPTSFPPRAQGSNLWQLVQGGKAVSSRKCFIALGHEIFCSKSYHLGASGKVLPWNSPMPESIPLEKSQDSYMSIPCHFSTAYLINGIQETFAPARWRVSQSWVQILSLTLFSCVNLNKSSVRRQGLSH
jgi:hypothetical protein